MKLMSGKCISMNYETTFIDVEDSIRKIEGVIFVICFFFVNFVEERLFMLRLYKVGRYKLIFL